MLLLRSLHYCRSSCFQAILCFAIMMTIDNRYVVGVQGRKNSPFRFQNSNNKGCNRISARSTVGIKVSGGETASTSAPASSTTSSRSNKKRRRRVVQPVVSNDGDVISVSPSECSLPTTSSSTTTPAVMEDEEDRNHADDETMATTTSGEEVETNKMPTLFSSSRETKYDTYAACLAATEGLRGSRDASIAKIKNKSAVQNADSDSSWKSSFLSKINNQKVAVDENDEEYKRACAQYVLQSTKVIRALGLTVGQFNQIGRELGNNDMLKHRVMEQAYLYRVASAINMKKIPLVEDPGSVQLLKGLKKGRIQMFASSMTEVEELRAGQLNRLMKALNIDRLPPGVSISDPAVLPILNPKIRAVVEAFPLQAEEVVKKYGLNSDEFNEMLMESRSNPIFRRKVEKLMKDQQTSSTPTTPKEKVRGLFGGATSPSSNSSQRRRSK